MLRFKCVKRAQMIYENNRGIKTLPLMTLNQITSGNMTTAKSYGPDEIKPGHLTQRIPKPMS